MSGSQTTDGAAGEDTAGGTEGGGGRETASKTHIHSSPQSEVSSISLPLTAEVTVCAVGYCHLALATPTLITICRYGNRVMR